MRALFSCLLLVACTEREEIAPRITGVSFAANLTSPLPLPLCDATAQVETIVVHGNGFVPSVEGADRDQPIVRNPAVAAVSSAGQVLPIPGARLQDPQTIGLDLGPFGGLPDGIYSIQVTDAVGAQSAVLANAVAVRPPPIIASFSPTSACWHNPTTFLLQGGPFTATARAYFATPKQSPGSVSVIASDRMSVSFPANPFADIIPFPIYIEDPPDCLQSILVAGACP
jgi:hypothetical protein